MTKSKKPTPDFGNVAAGHRDVVLEMAIIARLDIILAGEPGDYYFVDEEGLDYQDLLDTTADTGNLPQPRLKTP